VEYWEKARHRSRKSFQRMILPRSSMIQSRPSAPPRLQRRRMMSRTSRRQQSTSGLEVTADEVKNLIGSALNKSCQLDPAPTWLVKDMRGVLLPFVALLFSKSLKTGCFPAAFKLAVIHPLLQKSGLDPSQPKNYRPVSNLPFLSKSLERVVQIRLQVFLDSNNLMPATQSAYRQFHITETAVTAVYNDLLLAAYSGQVSALCLLDLTAAFDTVTPWITTCYCFVWSVSMVFAVSFCDGSSPTCLADHIESSMSTGRHPLFT